MIDSSITLTMLGHEVDTSPAALGELRNSSDLLDDPESLRRRMDEDGYLFLRGYLDRDEVMAARREVCQRLADMGVLNEAYPITEAIARPGAKGFYNPLPIVTVNRPLMKLLYTGRMIAFYEKLLGGAVRHFDYTWFRTQVPGTDGTNPHCDVVYMGRGTHRLFTSWTPIGDAPLEDGPLAVMPGSHRIAKLRDHYGKLDVDAVCTNRHDPDGQAKMQSPTFGQLTHNPVRLRANLDLPYLTTDYQAGDVLVFTIHTIHTSFDNHGQRIRLSSDSRYQLASDPADERWISTDGRAPIAHGPNARRELIC